MLLYVALITCADIDDTQIEMQRILMHKCFERCTTPSSPGAPIFKEEIIADGSEDPCSWRGVECVDGLVTSFVMVETKTRSRELYLDMDYLPSTVQALHLSRVYLYDTLVGSHLPRDLRYFYALRPYNIRNIYPTRDLRMDKLPRRLEEMQVAAGRFLPVSGVLVIANLPSTLRIFIIKTLFLKQVFIDNDGIPSGIQILNFDGNGKKVKIKEMNGEKLDNRVTREDVSLRRGSQWFKDLSRKAHQMEKLHDS